MSVTYRKPRGFKQKKSSAMKRESFHYFDCSDVTTVSMRVKNSEDEPSSKRATVDLSDISPQWSAMTRSMSNNNILTSIRASLHESLRNNSLPEFVDPPKSNRDKTPEMQMNVCGPIPFRKQSADKNVSKSQVNSSSKKPPVSRRPKREHQSSSSTNYMSKVRASGLQLKDFLVKDDVEDPPKTHRAVLSRSQSENEARYVKQKDAANTIVRNVFKSRSLKAKEEPLLKQVVRKVMPFKSRSSSDSSAEGGTLFHRRQAEIGGSAPTSPQTANKLPKIPNLFRKNSNSQKEKNKDDGSEESITDKEKSGGMQSPLRSSTPNRSPIYATPTRSVSNSSPETPCSTQKPDTDTFRKSNTLKLWIQEAKDIPDKKGYYCQLLLNGKKYDQTTTKIKNGLCFWGEHFIMNNIPERSVVTLRLLRKDKDKEKLIGYSEFEPQPIVQEPRLDRWVNLTTEKHYKDRDTPTLRCRHFLQQVTILPLAEYKGFVSYLKESSLSLCRRLESQLNVRAKEDIVKLLISVLQHYKKAVSFLGQLIIFDVEGSGKPDETMFRGNSMATKAIEAYMKLMSPFYLNQTLYRSITTIINSNKILEVDPNRLNSSDPIDEYRSNLQNSIEEIWNSILRSSKDFPVELQQVFYAVRERIKRPELSDHLISACVFLRLLCPAVLSPSLFNLTKEYPEAEANRKLTLVAKTLQTLANFTTYQSKETCMQFLNDFILREQDNCRLFLRTVSGPMIHRNQSCEYQEPIDLGLNLALLHIHLKHAMDTINSEILDSELRRLKRQLDYLSDCLARHANQHQSGRDLGPISDASTASSLIRRDTSTTSQHESDRSCSRRPFTNHRNFNPIYERSISCRPEIGSRYDQNRSPACDLTTSDNYVLQTAVPPSLDSTQDAHNIVNNNVVVPRPIYRPINNIEKSSVDNHEDMSPRRTPSQIHGHPSSTPKHRSVTKSVSTLIRPLLGSQHGDFPSDEFEWQPMNSLRDFENNMRASSPNLYPVSPKASSGYHSLVFSPSSSPVDQALLIPSNANLPGSPFCCVRSSSRLSGYESAQGSPLQRKAQSIPCTYHDDNNRFPQSFVSKNCRQDIARGSPSRGSPVLVNKPRDIRHGDYSPETPCKYETCHQLPNHRRNSSSSSSSSSPTTPSRRAPVIRRSSTRRHGNNNLVNRALTKSVGAAPRTNPHCSPRIGLSNGHTNSPMRRNCISLNENPGYAVPSEEKLILYDNESWPLSYSQDDHMQAILERLLTMEQEIRDEQESLMQEMSAKDRLLAKQKRHIAALDNANSQLIRQIASLTASGPGSAREKTSPDDNTNQENNEDISLESLSPSDVSDNNKSSSPC